MSTPRESETEDVLELTPEIARLPVRLSTRHDVAPNLADYIAVGVVKWSRSSPSMFAHVERDLQFLQSSGVIYTTTLQHRCHADREIVRIYVLKAKALHAAQALAVHATQALKRVMLNVDPSRRAWECDCDNDDAVERRGAGNEHESLFYIFNTLQSPEPEPSSTTINRPSREAIMDLLEGQVDYMKTTLYEYQRRSAAYMVQKESQETYFLDPRLEEIQGPEGAYYYDRIAGTVLSEKRLYPDVKGGILAETMGYGKTLICISVILATRGHLPRMMDDPHIELVSDFSSTGARTLIEMAAAANARYCLPWTSVLHLAAGRQLFQKYRNAYISHRDVGSSAFKYSRRREQKACRLFVSSATLIIVPPNLVTHWLHEIEKHVDTKEAGLRILVINDGKTKLPPAGELSEYDIVLFSKSRFGKEVGALNTYSLARQRNDALDPDEYSPLRQVYWLRVIVDEGHDFARSAAQTQSLQIFRLLHVERRWVVSGTPSKGLYGIEVPLGTSDETDISILESRKVGALDQEKANLDQLRAMMVEFLGVKPWSNPSGQDSAKWSTYIQPTGSGPTLRRTLQSLVVRHQPQDITITLPPLSNKVVALEPTFYDKLTANLFISLLTVNAVTSERTGRDYMFSANNKAHLSTTINNLRQAGFWWVGIKYADVESMVKEAQDHLQQHGLSSQDQHLLRQAILFGSMALDCAPWKACTSNDQLGVFVTGFPSHARDVWSLSHEGSNSESIMLGLLQAVSVKDFVDHHHGSVYAYDGLPGQGLRHRMVLTAARDTKKRSSSSAKSELLKDPPPSTPSPRKQPKFSPKKQPKSSPKKQSKSLAPQDMASTEAHPDFKETKIVATASAKLTYLLERVLEFSRTEKILIFYEHQHFGEWISWGLELLNVKFCLYGGAVDQKKRSEHLSMFMESEDIRVLLMDLKQASHGLHVACASRVFIVNPIWDPNVEGQAIKRAHRMSQTKPVFVETLVLKGTLEEKMLKRRKEMQASSEGMKHEQDLLSDRTMSDIIKEEKFIEIDDTATKFAPFETPLPLFNATSTTRATSTTTTTPQQPKPQLRAKSRTRAAPTPRTISIIDLSTPDPSPRPRPTYTGPAGISFDRPIVLSPSPSPSKRNKPPPDNMSASQQARKRRRVTFLDMEDPFVDTPPRSQQSPSS